MWWGLTPALDVTVERDNNSDLNVLLIAQSDCRHVLQTLARRYRHPECNNLKLYIYEPRLENIGRSLLFLLLALDEDLGLGPKTQHFMEIYGNTLLRKTAWEYLSTASEKLVKIITNFNFASKVLPSISLDNLKYKERDHLERIFNFWAQCTEREILNYWDQRLRALLSTRYDSKYGAFDWDLHMRYRPYGAETIGNQEYKCFREKGVSFLLGDADPSIANPTLSCFPPGATTPMPGYFGDIVSGPYPSFGIYSEEKELMKKYNGQFKKTATEITEWNLQQIFFEIANNCPFNPPKSEEGPCQVYRQDISVDLKVQKPECRNQRECDGFNSIVIQGTEIIFMPVNALKDYPSKPQFQNFFDIVTVPQHLVAQLPFNWGTLCKSSAKVIVESSKYVLDYRKEDLEKVKNECDSTLKNLSFEPVAEFDYKTDDFLRYQCIPNWA